MIGGVEVVPIVKYAVFTLLLVICYEDFKHRSIKVTVMMLFSLVAVFYYLVSGLDPINIWLNTAFVFTMILSVVGYVKLRFGSVKRLGRAYLGFGDLWLWLLFTPLLETAYFIVFFVVSLVAALVFHLTIRNFKIYGPSDVVPLAGIQSAVLIMYLLFIP